MYYAPFIFKHATILFQVVLSVLRGIVAIVVARNNHRRSSAAARSSGSGLWERLRVAACNAISKTR